MTTIDLKEFGAGHYGMPGDASAWPRSAPAGGTNTPTPRARLSNLKIPSPVKTGGKVALLIGAVGLAWKAIEPHVRGSKAGAYEALGIYNPVRKSLANMNFLGPAANIAGQRADMIGALMPGAPFQTKAAMANPMRMMMMNPLGMGMWRGGMGY